MTLTRRQTLSLIGGGLIVAAGAAGTTLALTATPAAALSPWNAAGGYDDPRMRALSHAILAPNPHNRQPWMVDLRQPDTATLYVDTDRMLPHTDPFNRQITIGLGCFLEVLRMAAAEDRHVTVVDLFPDGSDAKALDARPVAVIRFAPDDTARRDPLFGQVPYRRSLKEPYDMSRPVPDAALAAVIAAARVTQTDGTTDPARVSDLRQLSHDALVIEVETDRTYRESVELFRIGKTEVEANPDGIDFSGLLFQAMHLTGVMTREAAMDRTSVTYAEGFKAVLANCDTAMAHVWMVTPGNDRITQIAAGGDWVRMNLAATGLGLGVQPLSQALQEYPEMGAPHAGIHGRLAPQGGTVQMFARLGYGPSVAPSPRWPVGAKMMAG